MESQLAIFDRMSAIPDLQIDLQYVFIKSLEYVPLKNNSL